MVLVSTETLLKRSYDFDLVNIYIYIFSLKSNLERERLAKFIGQFSNGLHLSKQFQPATDCSSHVLLPGLETEQETR